MTNLCVTIASSTSRALKRPSSYLLLEVAVLPKHGRDCQLELMVCFLYAERDKCAKVRDVPLQLRPLQLQAIDLGARFLIPFPSQLPKTFGCQMGGVVSVGELGNTPLGARTLFFLLLSA